MLDYAHGKAGATANADARVSQLMGGIKQPKSGNSLPCPTRNCRVYGTAADCEFSVGRLALQFLIFTAARSGEVRRALEGLDSGQANGVVLRRIRKPTAEHRSARGTGARISRLYAESFGNEPNSSFSRA